MIIYCDGSANAHAKKHVLGWGIKIEEGEDGVEIYGARTVKFHQRWSHEIVAVIESIIYASTHGGTPETTTFYTDDQRTVYGTQWHNVHGWSDTFQISPALQSELNNVESMYTKEVMATVMEYFEKAQWYWVKGHKDSVNNRRVDYLAKRAMKMKAGLVSGSFLTFEEWIAHGFGLYLPNGTHTTRHEPFTSTLMAEIQDMKKAARLLKKPKKITSFYRHFAFLGEFLLGEDVHPFMLITE